MLPFPPVPCWRLDKEMSNSTLSCGGAVGEENISNVRCQVQLGFSPRGWKGEG